MKDQHTLTFLIKNMPIKLLYFFILALPSFVGFTQESKQYVLGVDPTAVQYFCLNKINCKFINSPEKRVLSLFEKNDINVEIEELPIKRLYMAFLTSKEVNIKYPDNPNWKRELRRDQQIYYSLPVREHIDGTFVHVDHQAMSVKKIKKLGVIRGFTPEPYLEAIKNSQIQLLSFENPKQLIKSLIYKRIDAIYGKKKDIETLTISNNERQQVVFNKLLPSKIVSFHFSSINEPKLIEEINRYLSDN